MMSCRPGRSMHFVNSFRIFHSCGLLGIMSVCSERAAAGEASDRGGRRRRGGEHGDARRHLRGRHRNREEHPDLQVANHKCYAIICT